MLLLIIASDSTNLTISNFNHCQPQKIVICVLNILFIFILYTSAKTFFCHSDIAFPVARPFKYCYSLIVKAKGCLVLIYIKPLQDD